MGCRGLGGMVWVDVKGCEGDGEVRGKGGQEGEKK